MFEQLIFIFSLISFLAVFAVSQEKPEIENKECSHSRCGTKDSHSEATLEKYNKPKAS